MNAPRTITTITTTTTVTTTNNNYYNNNNTVATSFTLIGAIRDFSAEKDIYVLNHPRVVFLHRARVN